MEFRYSRWDGSQRVPDLDADDLLAAMSDDLLADGDPWGALRRLVRQGLRDPQGQRLPGLQDLLQRLRKQRQERLDRYDLDSALADIRGKLDEVLRTEREGIRQRLPGGPERQQREQALDRLPPDPAGRLRELQAYDFVDPTARQQFEDLLRSLQQQMLQPFLKGMEQTLQGLTPQDLAQMRQMIQDLERMLRQRADGEEPDLERFREQWGQHFPGAESLDDLIEQLARQAAQMQSLMASLSPRQRQQLQDMMRSLFLRDERLEAAMAQLAATLGELVPLDELTRRHEFRGGEELGLAEAMRLMEELGQMEQLEAQLRQAHGPGDLQQIDAEQVGRLLGEQSRRELEQLQEVTRKLEEAGYVKREGDHLTLTARAIRKIGDRALRDVFAHLRRDRLGRHAVEHRGAGGERTDESRRYEFGDPFLLDLRETLMNAVERSGPGTPLRLSPGDFEVFRTELSAQASTVLMLDLSRSMLNNGYFVPAKKVAMALQALIRGQFPRDSLHVVTFSLDARQIEPDRLPWLSWMDSNVGTNMHAGFILARRLLGRQRAGNRQILLITDGEPTAHLEQGEPEFSYPPSRRTIEETLLEVRRCTREGITINTFMLEQTPWLTAFVDQMTRINRGRAFYASADRLGEYLLVDYVRSRRRRVS